MSTVIMWTVDSVALTVTCNNCLLTNRMCNENVNALVMQRYIVQTIYRVDIGHIVSYRYCQEKYRNFDISLSF